ncbi:hypothetical protein KUTeg_000895 [Tegillarca granosa]|uniref:Uncharacterized protein n=1 Tax=Tegillarca granosa TaxID=220873 RepID=A0ABQ9G0S3_TEGGR|nr:hypothetical protein KUTeg_000895 [Tegillarca granosa]
MSIVLPGRNLKVNFLAPSKAFQDAKETLGPEYFDAQLIECPQNAVELSKLIKEWDELDKQRFKAVEEVRRNQRVLLHTLSSRYTFSKSSNSLESLTSISDVKLPPPGFRYHADGSKKVEDGNGKKNSVLDLGTFEEDGEENDTIIVDTLIGKTSVAKVSIPQRIGFDKLVKTSKFDTTETKPLSSETEHYKDNHEIDKETLLRFKLEIEQMMADSDLRQELPKNASASRCRISKQLQFEPVSRSEPSTDKTHSNDGFPFRQKSSGFFRVENKIDALYKPIRKTPICSKCTACRYKLQHSSVDFRKLQQSLNNPKFRRWNIAPQGVLVESPKFSPRMASAIYRRSPRVPTNTGTSENQPMSESKTSSKGKLSQKAYTSNVKSKSPTNSQIKTMKSEKSHLPGRPQTARLPKSKPTSEVDVRNAKSANLRQTPMKVRNVKKK